MDTQPTDLNLLVALDVLLTELNVTRAAQRLHLSQPALSARLSRLRDAFGDPLLVPTQRGMAPTQRALALQAPLHAALDALRNVVAAQAPFDPASAEGTLTIAASDYLQYTHLMPLAFQLRAAAPGLRIAWRTIDGRALRGQVEAGDVDLALTTPEAAPPQLRARHLFDEQYVAIVRRHHPGVGQTLDLDTFCALDHAIVSPRGGGFSGPTDVALQALGRTRRVAMSVPNFLVIPDIVARSDMVALVPSRLVEGRAARLWVLAPPLPVGGFSISMLWHERTTSHPAQRWLREKLLGLVA